jgi:hypothetical protein
MVWTPPHLNGIAMCQTEDAYFPVTEREGHWRDWVSSKGTTLEQATDSRPTAPCLGVIPNCVGRKSGAYILPARGSVTWWFRDGISVIGEIL